MNKQGFIKSGILLVLIIIGTVVVFGWVAKIISPENIKISYVIPLSTGFVTAEIDYSTIQTIELKYKEFVSRIPLMDYEVVENSPFLVGFTITSPEKYENISLKVEHNDLLKDIKVSDKSRNPLQEVENNMFKFQKDLYPQDTTTLILTGNADGLGNTPYSGANFKILIFSNGGKVFESDDKTIKICKEGIEGGCSNKIKQTIDFFSSIITTENETINNQS